MSTASNFYKKVLKQPELVQIIFRVDVLTPYIGQREVSVTRTDTVGRVKAGTWSVDFGIAPDEESIHVTFAALSQRLPESEREHWLAHVHDAAFSENFLKMQGSHACIDDGMLRKWGEEPLI